MNHGVDNEVYIETINICRNVPVDGTWERWIINCKKWDERSSSALSMTVAFG